MNKKTKDIAGSVVRFAIGLGVVAFLLARMNRSSERIVFHTPEPVTAPKGSVYREQDNPAHRYLVIRDAERDAEIHTLRMAKSEKAIPDRGVLAIESGSGPSAIAWNGRTVEPYGLRLLGQSFQAAGRRWPFLLASLLTFFVCLLIVMVRWKMILAAQGLDISWGRTWSLLFIGHFFNAFLFGATGGDVVKAYYVAAETGHKKTEAVSTVFIDRVVGLFALILLAAATMLFRVRFFLSAPETRYAFLFLWVLALAVIAVFVLMLFTRRLMRTSPAFQRLAATRPGQIFLRAYESFYLCLSHPALLGKTMALSLLNHLCLIGIMFLLGGALAIPLTFMDYLSLGPTINAVGALPITPGGLGLRELAAVTYLGIVGVPAVKAMPLSLMLYATMLFWSLFGGVVFMLSSGKKPAVAAGDEQAYP